jgi:hypothetical protein
MEHYGFCNLSVIPVRAEASDRSEMVNQLLFGETFGIVDSFKSWKVVSGTLDNYQGFIDEKQFLPLDEAEYARLNSLPAIFPQDLVSKVFDEKAGTAMIIFTGSNLAGIENGKFVIGGRNYRFDGETFAPPKIINAGMLVDTAKLFLNSPYFWGGRSPSGIDCSGLVQVAYKIHGIPLNRDASYQAQQGETLNLFSEAEKGDLAFFDNEDGIITHVGIIADEGKIIHSSGQVRIDRIDHHGIYNDSLQKYTHKLRLVKRVIDG